MGKGTDFRDLKENSLRQKFFVIRELTSREIKRKYARSYLGIIWSVLSPLLHMIVMSVVFSYMFRRSIVNFPLYYLTGEIMWGLYKNGSYHSMSAIVDNKNMLIKSKLSKNTFILSRVYTALVNFGFSCIAYILVIVFFRIKPSLTMLVFIPDVILVVVFALGASYVLSVLYVFFADVKYLYEVFLTMWLYMNAVFYPVDALPEALQKIINYNPMYMAIYIAREGVIYGRWPHFTAWIKLAVAAIVMYSVGSLVFKKKQNSVMQVL